MNGTSVINPMIFYWMGVFDVLSTMGIFMLYICFCISAVSFIFSLDSSLKYETRNKLNKMFKISLILTVISLIITVFIPSKDTMLTMLVADMITYENIELTKESAIAIIDYIVEQVNMIVR